MFCTKCGKKMNDDAVFCSYCGTKNVNLKSGSEKVEIKGNVRGGSRKSVIEVPVKRPFMKFLYQVVLPIGIALLLYRCAIWTGVSYDRNEIRSFSKEYWEVYQQDAKSGKKVRNSDGVTTALPNLDDLEEKHHYIFFNKYNGNELIAQAKDKEDLINEVAKYYYEKSYANYALVFGMIFIVVGVVCRAAYRKAQKEEEEKIRE